MVNLYLSDNATTKNLILNQFTVFVVVANFEDKKK